jgi:hypothetical protein
LSHNQYLDTIYISPYRDVLRSVDQMTKGLRAYLHFQVFASNTKFASDTNTTTPTPIPTTSNEQKTDMATNRTGQLKLETSSSSPSVQLNDLIPSVLRLAQLAPSLNDTTYSSLSLITTTTTRPDVPQISVVLSSVAAMDNPTKYGYDHVIISLFNKLIGIGIGKKISYQRILIDWHADEYDSYCQGPDCSATILPFGSDQVQYLLSLPPPSPLEKGRYLQQKRSLRRRREANKVHPGVSVNNRDVSAKPTNQWTVPFLHFGERLLIKEQRWQPLWSVEGKLNVISDLKYRGERGGYMCGAAILTIKSIGELIFESLPYNIRMLAPLIAEMLPELQQWNKRTITCRDTLPVLHGGQTFSSAMIIDPAPIDKDITIRLSTPSIRMTPEVFEFKRNGVTSIPFTINVPENEARRSTEFRWRITEGNRPSRSNDERGGSDDDYKVMVGHLEYNEFNIQFDYRNTFIIHSPVALLKHIYLNHYGGAVLVSLSSLPLQLEMKITSLPTSIVTLSITCHNTGYYHDDDDDGKKEEEEGDDGDDEEEEEKEKHDNPQKNNKRDKQPIELMVSPELTFTNGGLSSLPFTVTLPSNMNSSMSPMTSPKVDGSRQIIELRFRILGDNKDHYHEPETMTLVIID